MNQAIIEPGQEGTMWCSIVYNACFKVDGIHRKEKGKSISYDIQG